MTAALFSDGSVLNFKVKHVKYNFDRFYLPSVGVPILPFDNDTLILASLALLVVTSVPEQKGIIIKLVMNMLFESNI